MSQSPTKKKTAAKKPVAKKTAPKKKVAAKTAPIAQPVHDAVWFTIPAFDALRLPAVEVPKVEFPKVELPKVDLPKVDVMAFATETKDKVSATAQDVRKNVSHTVVLLREVVGV